MCAAVFLLPNYVFKACTVQGHIYIHYSLTYLFMCGVFKDSIPQIMCFNMIEFLVKIKLKSMKESEHGLICIGVASFAEKNWRIHKTLRRSAAFSATMFEPQTSRVLKSC